MFEVFNRDIKEYGSYQYSLTSNYSALLSTKRQTEEIIRLIKLIPTKNLKVLDAGCGDGFFTIELAKHFKQSKFHGFDPAKMAIKKALKSKAESKLTNVRFTADNLYSLPKSITLRKYDLIILRGVLHHLPDPVKAVSKISGLSKYILIIEPNGLNPVLKLIERSSPYHIAHEEQSFKPSEIISWFKNFSVKKQYFFGLIPYFCPKIICLVLKKLEKPVEDNRFFAKFLCGVNALLLERT